MYQIFVVEDELLIRQSIRNAVEKMQGPYVFCGEASDGEMALFMMQDLMPDILLTDRTVRCGHRLSDAALYQVWSSYLRSRRKPAECIDAGHQCEAYAFFQLCGQRPSQWAGRVCVHHA